jgi:GAF domain-containing protein
MDASFDVARALAAAARANDRSPDLDETLAATVEAARSSIPGFDQVGISTLEVYGTVQTRAATSNLVYKLDYTQYKLGEGPTVDALREDDVVAAPRLRDDRRWPYYVRAAVQLGLRSQLTVRLPLDDQHVVGALNLYSTTSDAIEAEAEATARLFADRAANALSSSRQRATLTEARDTRAVVGQALGILMERYHLDEDSAFALLVRTSSRSGIGLRDIAERLVGRSTAD